MRKCILFTLTFFLLTSPSAHVALFDGQGGGQPARINHILGTIRLSNGQANFTRTNSLVTIDSYLGDRSEPSWSHSISIETINAVYKRWSKQKELEAKLVNLHGTCGTLLSIGSGFLSGALLYKLITTVQEITAGHQFSEPMFAYAIAVAAGSLAAVLTAVTYSNFNKSTSDKTAIELELMEKIRESAERYGTTSNLENITVQEFVSNLALLGLVPQEEILY